MFLKNRHKKQLYFLSLIFIFLVLILTRFWRLEAPCDYIFDEVYHAFTAKEMLYGKSAAWEWWNIAPQGFAYEWGHPPLAKLGMSWSMQIFGVSPFGWRFPSALLGVGTVILISLLAQKLFNRKIGLIAGYIATIEGLILVQSRIAMNDIYMLFFILLAFYFFALNIHRKHSKNVEFMLLLLVASCLGVAISAKWSAIFGLATLGFWFLLFKFFLFSKEFTKKQIKISGRFVFIVFTSISFLFLFIAIPIFIYIFSYGGFFDSGHSWHQFLELQKQIFYYHNNLKASHSYSSSWWTWPLMLRPVWYWVNYQPATIANIYAMGNPIVLWGGLLATLLATIGIIFKAIQIILNKLSQFRKSQKIRSSWLYKKIHKLNIINHRDVIPVVFILTGYFAFLLPWALAPRIMFFYHYLPCVPFLIIILAYFLGKAKKIYLLLFLAIATIVFIYFYPRYIGLPTSLEWSEGYLWLKSWE